MASHSSQCRPALVLSFFQRICYGNAMLHFFYGIPRLIFLTAPLTYLYFEVHIINAAAAMLALYVLPHILQANLANAHIQGAHRHSFLLVGIWTGNFRG